MTERETIAAKRYSAASVEQMALEAENAAAKLRGEPPPHKVREDVEDDEIELRREKKQQRVLTAARALLDAGTDPEVVARMMLQIPNNTPPQQSNGGSPSLTELIEALISLQTLTGANKGDSEVKLIIEEMRAERKETNALFLKAISELGGGGNGRTDPMTALKNQMSIVRDTFSVMREAAGEMGWAPVAKPGNSGPPPNNIEELKENHRHDEEMLKLNTEKSYKQSMADTIGELPERIGAGIASQFGNDNGSTKSNDGADVFKCQECQTPIFAPPTASRIKCPKCGAEYEKPAAKPEPRLTNQPVPSTKPIPADASTITPAAPVEPKVEPQDDKPGGLV